MEKQEQIRLIKQIMKHIDDGTTVDAGGIRHNPSWVRKWASPITR